MATNHIQGHGALQSEHTVAHNSRVGANSHSHRPPKRDWRDWFIMATVTIGVGYGVYEIAKVRTPSFLNPNAPTAWAFLT